MNNDYVETDLQKAIMLTEYFSSQTAIDDINKQLLYLPPAQHVLESIVITDQDVNDVLSHLDVTKACGPDPISPRLLKEEASILAHPFSIVFNRSLRQGYFPLVWKDSNLTPIHKKDDKSLPK